MGKNGKDQPREAVIENMKGERRQITLPWEVAGSGSRAFKGGATGLPGSGKTTTMAILAAYLCKRLNKTEAYMIDSEGGGDYVASIYKAAGVTLRTIRTREFPILVEAFEGMAKQDDVILVDSVTHFSEDITKKYLARKERAFLQLKDFGPIYDTWRLFSEAYTNSQLHALVCGRMGAVYESVVDEDGKTEMHKVDSKMKAADQFGHEPDFLLTMEQVVNAVAREQLRRSGNKNDRMRLASQINREQQMQIVATVRKDRSRLIMGEQFIFTPSKDDAKTIAAVEAAFKPVVDWHLKNKAQATLLQGSPSAAPLFAGDDRDYFRRQEAQKVALGEIQATYVRWFPSTSAKDRQAAVMVSEQVFGVRSSEAIEKLKLDVLQRALVRQGEEPCVLEQACIAQRELLDAAAEKPEKPAKAEKAPAAAASA